MAPQRAGISVIEITDWFPEPYCKSLANVVFRPIGMHEVCGALGAEFPRGARRPGRVEAHGHNFRHLHANAARGNLQAIFNLLQTYFGPLLGERRMLAQTINQKLFVAIHQRVIDSGSAQIDSGNNFHVFLLCFLARPQRRKSSLECGVILARSPEEKLTIVRHIVFNILLVPEKLPKMKGRGPWGF